jgi:hypothetical protein
MPFDGDFVPPVTPAPPTPPPAPLAHSLNAVMGWLDSHNGTLTALATLVVAAFTAALWRSTSKLWKEANRASEISRRAAQAAEKSADASVALLRDVERPWIVLEGALVRRREMGFEDEPLLPNNFFIKFKFRNVGRTPAMIDDVVVELADKREIGPEPTFTERSLHLRGAATLAADGTFDANEFGPGPQSKDVATKDVIFYVIFGKVSYREPNGRQHATGFAVEVSPHMAAFSSYPADAFTYWT